MVEQVLVNRLRIALARISRQVDRQVAGEGMTRTQLAMLGTMARRRSLRIGELAEIEGLNATMVSRLVGKLEAADLITRTPDVTDRRSVVVEVTPAGARLHSRLRARRTRLFTEHLAELPPGHADALVIALPALESLADALNSTAALARDGATR